MPPHIFQQTRLWQQTLERQPEPDNAAEARERLRNSFLRFRERAAILDMLFGVTPTDPLTFVTIVLLLGVVAMLACLIPAQRAMRVDPTVVLRHN